MIRQIKFDNSKNTMELTEILKKITFFEIIKIDILYSLYFIL